MSIYRTKSYWPHFFFGQKGENSQIRSSFKNGNFIRHFFLEIKREIYYYYNLQCNVLNCNYNEQERREPCENEM